MRHTLLLVALLAACLGAWGADEDAPPLESLLGKLLRARSSKEVEATLDLLAERIGARGGFADAGAFADWLGLVAPPAGRHPRVLLRRGWGYVTTGRGHEALEPLEAALAEEDTAPVALAYLGEARRQAGLPGPALEALTKAAQAGYDGAFLDEAAHKAAFELRRQTPLQGTDAEPPAYAIALEAYAHARERAATYATLARWILEDARSYARQPAERAYRWARFAAAQVLTALEHDPGVPGGARLAFDAAAALEPEDTAREGRTPRYECLGWAYRLGRGPDGDTHEIPAALALLAQVALRDGRFELAYRLARERLDISDSPLAREVLAALPPDVGD